MPMILDDPEYAVPVASDVPAVPVAGFVEHDAHADGAHADGAHADGAHADGAYADGAHDDGDPFVAAEIYAAAWHQAEMTFEAERQPTTQLSYFDILSPVFLPTPTVFEMHSQAYEADVANLAVPLTVHAPVPAPVPALPVDQSPELRHPESARPGSPIQSYTAADCLRALDLVSARLRYIIAEYRIWMAEEDARNMAEEDARNMAEEDTGHTAEEDTGPVPDPFFTATDCYQVYDDDV